MPESVHDHELIGLCQTIYWNQWQLGKEYEFELVDYFKSEAYAEGRGYYQIYYAIALHDIEEFKVIKGDNLILCISKISWMKAMSFLPAQVKIPCLRKYSEGKNLYVKVERKNDKAIIIRHQEPREPTEEQLVNAKKFYTIIKSLNKHNSK